MIYARLERFAPGVIRSWIRICVCHVFRGFRSTERNNHHPGNGYPFEFSIIVNSKDRFTISLSLSLFRKLNRKFHLQLELGTSTGGTVIYHNLFSRARAKSGGGEEQKLAPRERGRSIGQITTTQKGKRNENGLPGAKLSAIRSPSPASRFSRRWSHFCLAESSPPFFSPPSDIDFHIPFRYFRKKKKKKKKKILIFPPSKVTRKYV